MEAEECFGIKRLWLDDENCTDSGQGYRKPEVTEPDIVEDIPVTVSPLEAIATEINEPVSINHDRTLDVIVKLL